MLLHVINERCLSRAVQNNVQLYKGTLLHITKECCWSGAVQKSVQTLQKNAVARYKNMLSGTVQNNVQTLQKNTVARYKRTLLEWGSTKQCANFRTEGSTELNKRMLLHVTKERCWGGALQNNMQT